MLLEELACIELLDGLNQLRWRWRGAIRAQIGRGEPFERSSEFGMGRAWIPDRCHFAQGYTCPTRDTEGDERWRSRPFRSWSRALARPSSSTVACGSKIRRRCEAKRSIVWFTRPSLVKAKYVTARGG